MLPYAIFGGIPALQALGRQKITQRNNLRHGLATTQFKHDVTHIGRQSFGSSGFTHTQTGSLTADTIQRRHDNRTRLNHHPHPLLLGLHDKIGTTDADGSNRGVQAKAIMVFFTASSLKRMAPPAASRL